jgi:long-chain acyl-CoA synthetase
MKWLEQYSDRIQAEVEIPSIPVYCVLEQAAERYGNNEALSFYGRTLTYKELYGLANRFAAFLQQRGIQKGDRIAIMLPNCPQYVVAYYGILLAGAVVTQVNPMLMERELAHILQDSGSKMIIAYDLLYERVQAVQQETSVETIITVSLAPSKEAAVLQFPFEVCLQGAASLQPVFVNPKEDIAVLQYTGGTTGRSKGAMLTHYNIIANLVQTYEMFKEEITLGKECYLTVIPLFHVFGMTSGMNLSIYAGGKNILLPRFQLDEVLETIKRERPTIFPGVPTMFIAITNHPKAEKYNINSIRICNTGSAPMPVEVLKEFERKTGAQILEGYGLSEASPVTHVNPPFGIRKPGSIGIGIPSTQYKVVDVATGTNEMPAGELGELIIKGPQVMKGYWNMPEETAHAVRDGWLYTGDIATMDEDGYVYIVDRKKDMIIAGGFNIYPRDVEEVLYEHPAVQEAVVVGVPDSYRGETLKAVLVLKEGRTATEEEIIDYCRSLMAAYKVPRIVEFRNSLPKTNVGKILRRAIREEMTQA